MQAETIRSGLTESIDRTSAVAVDRSGKVLIAWGDPDRPLYYRSAAKPFQATASLEMGAQLRGESLAVACASHFGSPAHLAYVRAILTNVGLDESALQTPPDWPISEISRDRLLRNGHRRPRSVFHNCSGKHAGWLAASVAAGLPVSSYLEYDHPVQVASREIVADATHLDVEPTGIDGCGAPTLRGSIRGLARGFAELTVDTRYRRVATAVTRYAGLVGGSDFEATQIAQWWPGPLKVGAEGLLAAGRDGIGIAVKSGAGSHWVAAMAMIDAMDRLSLLPAAAMDALEGVAQPPVLGGGRVVGRAEHRDGG